MTEENLPIPNPGIICSFMWASTLSHRCTHKHTHALGKNSTTYNIPLSRRCFSGGIFEISVSGSKGVGQKVVDAY